MRYLILLVCLVMAMHDHLAAQNLDNGLIFYAPFDGATVNLVEWVKPQHHGVQFVADKFGRPNRAVAFTGFGSYLDYGDILSLHRKNYSISLWVAVDAPAISGQLLGKGASPATEGSYGLSNTIGPINGLTFRFNTEDNHLNTAPAGSITSGIWQHLLITKDIHGIQFFLNGHLVNESFSPDENLHNHAPFVLGARLGQAKQAHHFFKGRLDEVRIYNRKLTAREVQLLYTQFQFIDGIQPIETPPTMLSFTPYPNPTTRVLNVDFPSLADRKLEIVDASGRMIRYFRSESQRIELPVAGLPPGNYFLRVIENGQVAVKQFVKKGAVIP